MHGQSDAKTVEEYINRLDEPRRSELTELDGLVRSIAPELKPTMNYRMPGYGNFHYKYASGREGDWAVLQMASNKNYISFYVSCTDDRGYVAESYKDRLPKASIGKSCIRFKKLSDIDMDVMKEIIQKSAKWWAVQS
jgi:uncharacterized protein YdhG (YjbR/CyaY superfamily)